MTGKLLSILRALAFVLLALALCGLVFELAGFSAPQMFQSIADGAFTSPGALMKSLRWAMPLLITACGVLVSFRCGYFNVGAQGQFYLGAITVAALGSKLLAGLPAVLLIPALLIAGAIAGMVLILVPLWLRLRFSVDEVVTSLLLNFVALLFVSMLIDGVLKDPLAFGWPQSMPVSESEIKADRDRLRAEYAIKVHKLETHLDQAKLERARHLIEINRRDASISPVTAATNA